MRTFFIILISCFTSLSALAQAQAPAWQIFSPANEEFSIEFPSLPFTLNLPDERGRRYYVSLNETFFFISTDQPGDDSQYKTALNFINQFQQKGNIKKLSGIKVENFSFADSENFYHTALIAKTKNRTYVFQTISPLKENPLTVRFFANLKLTEKIGAEASKLQENLPRPVPTFPAGLALDPPPADTPPPPPPKVPQSNIKGLAIHSKPRALFPELAVFYGVDGTITLRVTFLASGQIGAIEPVNKLPFGLTMSAVEAAKKMKFVPATKDGTPYTVTKLVQYSFTIY